MSEEGKSDKSKKQGKSKKVSSRLAWLGWIAALGLGGVLLYSHFQPKVLRGENGEFQGITIVSRSAPGEGDDLQPPRPPGSTIRIATFNLDGLRENKLTNLQIDDVLVPLLSQFDVVALQGIQARQRGVLLRLGEQINAAGRAYSMVTGRNALHPTSAFLFDRSSVEIDHSLAEPVEDPQDRFTHRPLVALFRVRGLDPSEAFTFKLVNVYTHHTDRDRTAIESDLLDDVYRAVRDDGSNEDDVILLGSFGADTRRMDQFGRILDLVWAITDVPTMVDGGSPVDNILFDRVATCEFTGRAEVLDLVREFKLTPMAAKQVSSHLPVWAEFQLHEKKGSELFSIDGRAVLP